MLAAPTKEAVAVLLRLARTDLPSMLPARLGRDSDGFYSRLEQDAQVQERGTDLQIPSGTKKRRLGVIGVSNVAEL